MMTIQADRPFIQPPQWAILQRQLFDLMSDAAELFMSRYIHPDGMIKWPVTDHHVGIDALDDAYESFHNFPLFYILGGHSKFKEWSQRQYDAITLQFSKYDTGTGYKMVEKEYEQGYDWFHQGEGYLFFYYMGLMDPSNDRNRERAMRYAGLYMNEDPKADNYDAELNLIRSPHNGSMGAAFRNFERPEATWDYQEWMKYYGLMFHDLDGVHHIYDLKDSNAAEKMGQAVLERMSKGDVPLNLLVTSMMLHAFMFTGDQKYSEWAVRYINGWISRTTENKGIIPDNVGLNGEIGEHINGKWYGGYYGWTWPHGWLSIGPAVFAAAENAALLSSNLSYLQFSRSQMDMLRSRAVVHEGTTYVPYKYGDTGVVHQYEMAWGGALYEDMTELEAFVPEEKKLLARDGWFEFQRISPMYPVHLWYMSMEDKDKALLESYCDEPPAGIPYVGSKDMGGHDEEWIQYLEGRYEQYPVEILNHNLAQVYHRLFFMQTDQQEPHTYTDDYLQIRNPLSVEGLVQLTMGAPLPIYNGGLLMARLRYFDDAAKRPGLPPNVGALVERLEDRCTHVRLANLHPTETRSVIIQAGAFGEHQFEEVQWTMKSDIPLAIGDLTNPTTHGKYPKNLDPPALAWKQQKIDSRWITVELAPGCETKLILTMRRLVNAPSYVEPWSEQGEKVQ